MNKLLVLACILTLAVTTCVAQEETKSDKYTAHNKGKMFLFWGGNNENYTRSDIHFRGDGYNFTLYDVAAHDKPRGWSIDYINPSRMTIPQTNFQLGYFVSDHYSISLNVDHMKYVMTQYQNAKISGHINLPEDQPGSEFNGIYDNDDMYMTHDFLKFEHTDGLNYVHLGVNRVDDIGKYLNFIDSDIVQINLTEGIGGGILVPKTNATLLSKERHDNFHISGYGASVEAGLNLTFFKYFYVKGSLKGGYINMPKIRTTWDTADKASQHFLFLEKIVGFGVIFKVF